MTDERDDRPVIEPTFFSYRELPDGPEQGQALIREMAEKQRDDGATFFRVTEVSERYPQPPYPYGFYVEGWKDLPKGGWKQAPFNFPLTAEAA